MTRLDVSLHPTKDPRTFRLVASFRCDSCGWETTTPRSNASGRPMRLRPLRPAPTSGPILHECEECAVRRSRGG